MGKRDVKIMAKATYRLELRMDDEFNKRLEIIRKYENEKRGNDKTTHAVKSAIYYYSDKILEDKV